MPKILFNPSGKSVDVPAGTRLLDAVRQAGIELDSPCGGKGACGKCMVRIESGDFKTDSLGIVPRAATDEGFVLACRTNVSDSGLTVAAPEPAGRAGGRFVEDEDAEWLVRDELPAHPEFSDPLVMTFQLKVPGPRLEDGLSDLDRLERSIRKLTGSREIETSLDVIRGLAGALRENEGKVTVALTNGAKFDRVIDVKSGGGSAQSIGLAVDVGTTTVAVRLIALPSGRVLATRADYNAQIACGLDVISRIHYARDAVRLEELRLRAVGTVNSLVLNAVRSQGLPAESILGAVIAGNTTMVHLLLGLDPEFIRLEPYTPTVHRLPRFTADEIGIAIHPRSSILICPSVGSYVGGDITAGLLCTEFTEKTGTVSLFMDIGTNGELVVGNRDFLLACACSAGPAFEGGGVEHGMRAAGGAIEKVEIDPATGLARYWTIGGTKPLGLCGSGMISLLAELFRTGWMDPAGKLNRTRASPAIRVEGRRARYRVVPSEDSGTGGDIAVSETDIEAVIRAKAAIYSAIGLLLDRAEVGIEKIETFYIAGGFGRYLNLEDATAIGLIPDLPADRFKFIGNASLAGASRALVSRKYRERLFELADRMTYIELNTSPEYMDQYTAALFLPHTDGKRFPSAQRPVDPHQQ
jgi:uncharacterized 2Fe-2S/4Fe-4S cluster protein (DUF4445 family)